MNLDFIKKYIKSNAKLECLYMTCCALNNIELAKQMVGTKRNPNNIVVHNYGDENSNIFIYHILLDEEARFNGFCSLYRIMLMHLAYAEDMMFTPVVTFGKHTLYYDSTIKFTDNVFEYFFNPVSDISYDSVKHSKRVVISKGADAGKFGTTNDYKVSQDEIDFLAKYQKKYISLREDVRASFWSELEEIISGGMTLGVHVRATDFNKGYNRHPVVVTPEEYLETTIKVFNNNGYKKVFLATDDESIVDMFKSRFGENLRYYSDIYRSTNGEAIHYGNNESPREHHKYYLGVDIIKDFYTLGYCAGLIAGNSNVSMCARIIKESVDGKYVSLNIIDKGVNHNMHETRSKFGTMLKK